MTIFNKPSQEFYGWLNGMEHERGFSKVLTKEADFRVSTSVHTILDAEHLLAGFLVLKDDASYVVFSFRNMTYLFKGSCDEVEARVRSLPLGRFKLPARKVLVKSIAESLSHIFKVMRGRASGGKVSTWAWYQSHLNEPTQTELPTITSVEKEPETPGEIREFVKNANSWVYGKAQKQLEYYFHREDVEDDVIQDAINIVLAEEILSS